MDVIEAEIKCQAERHASGDARRAAMDAEYASHTRGASLDDTNTNNMNKHMQQGRRGTTNFILGESITRCESLWGHLRALKAQKGLIRIRN